MPYSYRDEVKEQFISNISKIAIPTLMPLYLALNLADWLVFPAFGIEFLIVRLSILPVITICYLGVHKNWFETWYQTSVWICGFVVSGHLTYMAYRSGSFSFYMHTINMLAGALVFLFPMRLARNVTTLASVYVPPLGLFLYEAFWHTLDQGDMAVLVMYLAMSVIFCAAATHFDRMRHRSFQQKVDLFFMATTDVLSGLKLRRYFFNRFIQEIALRLRTSSDMVLSVAIMDIDTFKDLNDRYGHALGDACIKHIGELVRSSIRVYDVACRFGGEEFIVLFPETTVEEARIVCERIRKHVEETPFGAQQIPMTVSIGIAGLECAVPETLRQPRTENHRLLLIKQMMRVIRQADEALYEAKSAGKNRVAAAAVGGGLLATEVDEDEKADLKEYLAYFEQPLLLLEPEVGRVVPKEGGELNFYPEEFFFRRCVEGLYRSSRTPQWKELLGVLRVAHAENPELRSDLSRMFRVSDTLCEIGEGTFAVIFFNTPAENLPAILARLKANLRDDGSGRLRLTLAAAQLAFGPRVPPPHLTYHDFSQRVSELFAVLKHRHFRADEELYFLETGEEKKAFRFAV